MNGTRFARPMIVAMAVVLVGCGVAAALWLTLRSWPAARSDDCAVVGDMAQQWTSTLSSVRHELELGHGERADLQAVADREAEMGERLRAAARQVSTPGFDDQFDTWADGAALTAELQRDAVDEPPKARFGAVDDASAGRQLRAAAMIDRASAALLNACPNARPSDHG